MSSPHRAPARGNENNQHQPDGVYYLGQGERRLRDCEPAALSARTTPELAAHVRNLSIASTYGRAARGHRDGQGNFIARPFAPINGVFPVQQSTFYARGPGRSGSGLRCILNFRI
jgi:hypothetical protein